MSTTEANAIQEYNDAYQYAQAYWSGYFVEAEKDLKFYLGDQWNAQLYEYLKGQRREAYVKNKIQRVVHMIAGYQRKNRLAIKVDPVEGGDERTASQLSGVLQWIMQNGDGHSDGYTAMSDAFQFGPLVTGFNLVHVFLDRSQDPVSGDLAFRRCPYNKFLIDPMTTDRALRSCGFLMRREFVTPDTAKVLLPWAHRDIDGLQPSGPDGKYDKFTMPPAIGGHKRLKYDEMWARETKPVKAIIDRRSGAVRVLPAGIDRELLRTVLALSPGSEVVTVQKQHVQLRVMLEGHVFYQGKDPSGLEDEYPMVGAWGLWAPEHGDSKYALQGLCRIMRDPQEQTNKMDSKATDIIESQIASGWKAKADSVVDPKSLYQSGQSKVVWIKPDKALEDAQQITPTPLPAGLFQLMESRSGDEMDVAGVNSELFGMSEKDDIQVAGILAKLRQGAGLTVLQCSFDNHRASKKLLGQKLIRTVQRNYTPDKVERIIAEKPTQEFFDRRFGRYDAIVSEGVLTDSQRQMYYTQLMGMKQAGAPIPWAAIIDAAPLENKHKLKEMIEAQEQAQAQAGQMQQKLQTLQLALLQAKLMEDVASTRERTSQAQENRAGAMLDRAKAVKELRGMDMEQVLRVVEILNSIAVAQQQPQGAGGINGPRYMAGATTGGIPQPPQPQQTMPGGFRG